ncbi:MAG: hypothetical protein HY866_19095 [Chloroflexi bacterium]|nr:hypothetical protein [Chloroflexota bacterium]
MRSNRNRGPRWNRLYLILLVVAAVLVLGHKLHVSPAEHKIILLGTIVVIYVLVGGWIKSNAAALQDIDAEAYQKQRRDPAVYGTAEFPTNTQAHFKHVTSFYRHETPD